MATNTTSATQPPSNEFKPSFWRDVVLRKATFWGVLYFLLLPTIVSMAVFGYYPKIDVVVMSLYRWRPPTTEEFIGFSNFLSAFSDPLFWQSFQLVGILLVANILKLWPGIIAAIALHRLTSDKWRYWYQVAFVIPMVVPGIVHLLIWKSFYDPEFGILNRLLNMTGIMSLLEFLDGTRTEPGLMPKIAHLLDPVFSGVVQPVFNSVWGMIALGAMILTVSTWSRPFPGGKAKTYGLLIGVAAVLPVFLAASILEGLNGVVVMVVAVIFMLYFLSKCMGDKWILWPFLLLGGIAGFWGNQWGVPLGSMFLLPLSVALAIGLREFVVKRYDAFRTRDILRTTGGALVGIGALLVFFGLIWDRPTGQFIEGTPAWLGSRDLVIPALIFWGFPWVGMVGVLIYLSGLQNISQDVYEAAELDGVGPAGMLFHIELPLIMTQVRINLIFLTIGTLTGYEMFLLLLGADGGPGNAGMVPGLYMFKKAFEEAQFGYSCALGMVLFFIVLGLTIVYNRYVKVEK